ncbi:MAG: phenylacetate-CoA oxygenase subunit PaaI [Alphaproteobacteria bacterium]|nr:MAG: phenylacetate-CoA oxygenase subunit PaaI [Alphaproteobacteria bacterium]
MDRPLFDGLIELADDHVILGQRLGEWCGHAPTLEEDLALTNLALDLIGTARTLYDYAARIEGQGRTEDDLCFLRVEREFRNLLLVERPNGDFAHTIARQFFFAAFMHPFWQAAQDSGDEVVRGVAGKAVKEMAYHVRHSGEWIIRLGDGTDESRRRMIAALEALAPYVEELFVSSPAAAELERRGVLPERAAMRPAFEATLGRVLAEAGLEMPEVPWPQTGGREGLHTEDLGHILAEMQYMQRAYPGCQW